ncbi:MAG: hypothetical protein KC978_13765 [Candidatus Omnitrophica bacterium]|nr:hypothetical protein [Candidatus Omnitrophota bacterium]
MSGASAVRLPLWKVLAFLILTVLGFFVCVELATRVFYTPSPPKEFRAFINPEWEIRDLYQRDPVVFWKFRPSQVLRVNSDIYGRFEIPINNQGFRGKDWPRAHPVDDYLRILVVGDSCVFGWGADADESFPEQMEKILNSDSRLSTPVDVMNAGTPGHSSYQALQVLKYWAKEYDPDWVIPFVGSNDALPCVGRNDLELARIPPKPAWREFIEQFRFWRLLEDVWRGFDSSGEDLQAMTQTALENMASGPRRVPVDQFEKNLLEMHRFSEEIGARNILLTRQSALPDPILDRYNETIRRIAQEKDIPLVEVAGRFLDYATAEVYANVEHDPVHPNSRGYGLIAEWTSEKLVQEMKKGASE